MEIPNKLSQLVQKFEKTNTLSLNHSTLIKDFIEPFFQILGWNFDNEHQNLNPVPEVSRISKLKDCSPDYLFKTYDSSFYVSVCDISKNNILNSSEYQAIHQISWTSDFPIGLIFNFHKLLVLNLNNKPGSKPKIIFSCKFEKYENQWQKIHNLISKKSIGEGSLNKYYSDSISTSYYFLANKMLDWYYSIEKNIKSKSYDLSEVEIQTTAVRIINRLMMLRFCENLGLEPSSQLKKLTAGSKIYKSLLILFEKANEKYNSGLFYFKKESIRNTDSLDLWSFNIDIDDQIIESLIAYLYDDNLPLNFEVIPVNIIAIASDIFIKHINDKSLGRKVNSQYVKIYSAHKKRKIIQKIVEKSHKNLLEGKKPGIRSSVTNLKILDPCCGSGLFLMYSYEYLIQWHIRSYLRLLSSNENDKNKLPINQIENGHWQLSWNEKKQILINNLYGLDISRIAIESAELILLLKLLEDISPDNIQDQLKLFWQHALPDLGQNLKCGNALIESDIYKLQQFVSINESQKFTINAFDWQKEFKHFHPAENFDVIIGQLPSFFSEFFIQLTKPYFKQRFAYFKDFKNSYLLFYEKSLKLLKKHGIMIFVVPNEWVLNVESFKIIKNYWLKELYKLSFGTKSENDRIITYIKKQPEGETEVAIIKNLNFTKPSKIHHFKYTNFLNINYFLGYFEKYFNSELKEKIEKNSNFLSEFALTFSGYNAYEKGKGQDPDGGLQTSQTIKSRPYHSNFKLNEQWKTEIVGRDISRYCLQFTGMRWIKYGTWLAAARDPEIFNGPRILVHERISATNGRIEAAICSNEVYHGRDIIAIKPKIDVPNIYFLLGIINSKLFNWFYLVNFSAKSDEAFPKLLIANLNTSPIKNINFDNLREKNAYQELTSLVKRNIELNQKVLEISSERDKITTKKMIVNNDQEIDQLIYKIYDLSKSEIDILSESFKASEVI